MKKEVRNYFGVLEPEFPEWLEEYIRTPAILRGRGISNNCGMVYTDLFPSNFFYSNFDHSLGVALVVWHFTHDKKQTLAGLFHDIATPVFKHCVDIMNGDRLKQESLEYLNSDFIENSNDIMRLLESDGIALLLYDKLGLDELAEIYNDIEIGKNEDGVLELGFKTKALARKFVKITSEMSIFYRDERSRYSSRFIADILKCLIQDKKIMPKDLYEKSEAEILGIIESSKYGAAFLKWRKAREFPKFVKLRKVILRKI